jgi:hypothetical protein
MPNSRSFCIINYSIVRRNSPTNLSLFAILYRKKPKNGKMSAQYLLPVIQIPIRIVIQTPMRIGPNPTINQYIDSLSLLIDPPL